MYCGTSNIVLPVANKSLFPPEYRNLSRLRYYSTLFNSVEINQTFYKLPRPLTIERWAADVQNGFRFSVKMWKGITHNKQLAYLPDDVIRFMHTVSGFGNTKGALLIQLPAGTTGENLDRLASLLALVSKHNDGWRIAVECRHVSWYTPQLEDLLKSHRATLVEHDMPASMVIAPLAGTPFRYIRFHGIAGDYHGSYGQSQLRTHAEDFRTSENRGREVFCYFNNTIGDAVFNALALQTLYTDTAAITPASKRDQDFDQ